MKTSTSIRIGTTLCSDCEKINNTSWSPLHISWKSLEKVFNPPPGTARRTKAIITTCNNNNIDEFSQCPPHGELHYV